MMPLYIWTLWLWSGFFSISWHCCFAFMLTGAEGMLVTLKNLGKGGKQISGFNNQNFMKK